MNTIYQIKDRDTAQILMQSINKAYAEQLNKQYKAKGIRTIILSLTNNQIKAA